MSEKLDRIVLWGHSIAPHVLFGWCSLCPGRSTDEEVAAWWGWATANVEEVFDAVREING